LVLLFCHHFKEEPMNWIVMLIMTILAPVVQPMVQRGAERVQAQLQQNQPQYGQPSPQPRFVYHEGRWWKFENGQWYFEVKE